MLPCTTLFQSTPPRGERLSPGKTLSGNEKTTPIRDPGRARANGPAGIDGKIINLLIHDVKQPARTSPEIPVCLGFAPPAPPSEDQRAIEVERSRLGNTPRGAAEVQVPVRPPRFGGSATTYEGPTAKSGLSFFFCPPFSIESPGRTARPAGLAGPGGRR